MELLQPVEKFENTEADCPLSADGCRLYFDSDNTRVVLKLAFKAERPDISDAKIDVCCYGSDGNALTIMDGIPYIPHGMLLEIPSLMTKYAAVVIRSASFADGTRWIGSSDLPKSIDVFSDADEDFEDTHAFNSVSVDDDYCEDKTDIGYYGEYDDYDEYDDSISGQSRAERRAKRRELKRIKREEAEEIRDFIKNDPTEKRKRRIRRLVVLVILILAGLGARYGYGYFSEANALYNKGMNLYNSGKFADAVTTLDRAAQYRFFGEKDKTLKWSLAMSYARERNFNKAEVYFKRLGDYKESRENYRSISDAMSKLAAAGKYHTIALKSDGTVAAAGTNNKGQCDVTNWSGITKVAAGGEHSVGLKTDKTVTAAGDKSFGQDKVSAWRNIIDIAAGYGHTVAVENSGRVYAAGDNSYGQCDTGGWSGVVSVAAGNAHTVGLKIDGTVVAAGSNTHGECSVENWSNIVQIAAGNGFTVGLTYDGKVMVAGDKSRGTDGAEKAKDVLFISSGAYNVIVTDTNGHTTAYGGNDSNQSVTDLWKNIISTNGGENHSIGVAADGTVFGSGGNESGQISLSDWKNIGLPPGCVTIYKGE